jgi:urea carboxylase
VPNVRVDTWVATGTEVTANFDPLIAKVMTYAETRAEAVTAMQAALAHTTLKGSITNLKYLQAILEFPEFVGGTYDLGILSRVGMQPPTGMKVVDAGLYSSIQDYPGRAAKNGELGEFWRIGIPPSGPMDDFSSRLANALLGNSESAATLEVTVRGPTLCFLEPTVIAVTGALFGSATLDGAPFPMHTSVAVAAGATLKLGLVSAGAGGQRGYLAVAGGFDVPMFLGSRSTFPLGQMGGHQGRPLLAGDTVPIGAEPNPTVKAGVTCEPAPMAATEWKVGCVVGPHASPDFLTDAGMKMFFDTAWRVHHNSNRNGVRLLGPKPEWARPDGGAGGSHPSNVIDNEYAVGTINFTGDMPIFIGRDGPSLGGFVCNVTVPQAEMWKMGQVKPDDLITFEPIPMSECLARRTAQLASLKAVYTASGAVAAPPLTPPISLDEEFAKTVDTGGAVLYRTSHAGDGTTHPDVCCRLQGDEYVLVEYGPPEMDLRLRFRVEGIERYLRGCGAKGLLETSPGVRSLQIRYDNTLLSLSALQALLLKADAEVPSADTMKVTTRVLHLPCVLHDKWCKDAVERYTQSNKAANGEHWTRPYLPDNSEFVAQQNGLKDVDAVNDIILKASYMVLGLGDVYLGCPAALPVDPTRTATCV